MSYLQSVRRRFDQLFSYGQWVRISRLALDSSSKMECLRCLHRIFYGPIFVCTQHSPQQLPPGQQMASSVAANLVHSVCNQELIQEWSHALFLELESVRLVTSLWGSAWFRSFVSEFEDSPTHLKRSTHWCFSTSWESLWAHYLSDQYRGPPQCWGQWTQLFSQ